MQKVQTYIVESWDSEGCPSLIDEQHFKGNFKSGISLTLGSKTKDFEQICKYTNALTFKRFRH